MLEVISRLIPTACDSEYFLSDRGEPRIQKLTALKLLETHGRAKMVQNDDSRWVITSLGKATLQLSLALHSPTKALKVSEGKPLHQQSHFELLWRLEQEGWTCRVKCKGNHKHVGKKEKKKPKAVLAPVGSVTLVPIPYVHGGPKDWWIRYNSKTILDMYLVALLTAATHKKEVAHFKTGISYEDLMGIGVGQRKRKRRKKRTCEFDTTMDDGCMILEPKPPPKKRPKTLKKAKPIAVEVSDVTDEKVEADPTDEKVESDDSDSDNDDDDDSDSDNDDDSDTTGSSSSDGLGPKPKSPSCRSSSSSSPSQDSDAVPIPHPEVVTPVPVPKEYELPHETCDWKGFRFTGIYDKKADVETLIGWQATCYNCDGPPPACRRKRLFGVNGGKLHTERLLKHWALQAFSVAVKPLVPVVAVGKMIKVDVRKKHRGVPEIKDADLPSTYDLEQVVV